MRCAVVLFAFALSALGFAPAPFPRPQRQSRETPSQQRWREMREWESRSKELGVRWEVENRAGLAHLSFHVRHPVNQGRAVGGSVPVSDGGLPAAMRVILRHVEAYVRGGRVG